jgi:hypothetical protein
MFFDFIQALSQFAYDIGFVLPCWDIIVESRGICR